MAHVIKTLQDNLKDDPFFASYATPAVLQKLLDAGALGQKSGAGFYKKVGKDILRYDAEKGDYVAGGGKADEIVARILKKPPAERLKLLHDSKNPQAQFLWAILRDSFHYAAVHLADVAESARDIDFAMRWGFGTSAGPFELWQQAGLVAGGAVGQGRHRRRARRSRRRRCRPGCSTGSAAATPACIAPRARTAPRHARFDPPSTLPVYERQPFRESVSGSNAPAPLKAGTEVFKNDDVRVWTLDGQVLIASITAKLHLISPGVIEGLLKGVELAEQSYQGLVIWSPDDVFSAGANLEALMPVFMKSGGKGILPEVKKLQDAMLAVRYAQVPVVAAMRGIALGGGCEMALYASKRVAAMETYVGLVEVGVGLIPAGGGLAYIARRAAEMASAVGANVDLLKFITDPFTSAATARVGTSAIESRKMGWLLEGDVIVPHKDELLHVATQQVKAMAESGWRAPARAPFPAAGRNAIATIKAQLVNLRDGGFASAHDFHIATQIAEVVCGGDVDAGSLVTEEYLMTMERVRFCALLDHPKTQERIMGMLQTGKPVRN
jgi:3-hydroxyacyl-CoA dehydrogenase